jgi:flagellar biosynthesis chaperone FliJ
MKTFAFPLSRVMDWRQTQVQIETATLERLHAELRGLETRITETRAAAEQSEKALLAAESIMGEDLFALDRFKKAAVVECAKLARAAAESRQRISAQLDVVIRKRQDFRLLEKLRQRKLEAWKADLGREIDREAGELYLARLAAVRATHPL